MSAAAGGELGERAAVSWPLTYALVLAAQAPAVLVRFLLVGVLAEIVLAIAGEPQTIALPVAFVAGLGPLVWSLLAIVMPDRGWLVRQRMGARRPSERERQLIDAALARLAQRTDRLPRPATVWVLDDRFDGAFAVGESIVVSRACLEGSLQCVLAHELGHLAHHDGRHTHALNRLLVPRRALLPARRLARWMLLLLTGELSLRLTTPVWGEHFRAREHAADRYAASLGCAHDLADHFEGVLAGEQPVPFRWLSGYSHPPTEHRIQRLRDAADTHDDRQGEPV